LVIRILILKIVSYFDIRASDLFIDETAILNEFAAIVYEILEKEV